MKMTMVNSGLKGLNPLYILADYITVIGNVCLNIKICKMFDLKKKQI